MSEKIRLIVRKVLWAALVATCVAFVFVWVKNCPLPTVVRYDGYGEYFEEENSTECTVELYFDRGVVGEATFAFYGQDGTEITRQTKKFSTDFIGGVTFDFTVEGETSEYEFLDWNYTLSYTLEDVAVLSVVAFVGIVLLYIWICVMFHSCEEYAYGDDQILVYSGWKHHYIKVNGVVCGSFNTGMTHFSSIVLSCGLSDGAVVTVRISNRHRINFSIDGASQNLIAV